MKVTIPMDFKDTPLIETAPEFHQTDLYII